MNKRLKRVLTGALLLVLCLLCFTACNGSSVESLEGLGDGAFALDEEGNIIVTLEDGTEKTIGKVKTIVSADVNEEMHLIITYSDGTTEDKGYVGPESCTVTFVDHDGSFIAAVDTYVGLGVVPPANPEREDYIFAGWDKNFAKVTENMTVTATYIAKETFTVTFVDYDGRNIKTEKVVAGKGATAPADPERDGYAFAGWDKDFSVVTENMTVTAKYAEKGTFTVTFLDHNGLVLDVVSVKEGKNAKTSVTPTREGYTFIGWDGSLNDIKANKTVTAQYKILPTENVFDLSYKMTGKTVKLTLSLDGEVCLSGFEGVLSFEGMTATSVVSISSNAVANLKDDGTVYVVYTSATNVTKAEKVITVTLETTGDQGKAILELKECFDQDFEDVSYTIIGQDLVFK